MESVGCSSSKSFISDTNSLDSNETPKSNPFARLKRLKIQESLLLKSINKSIKQVSDNEYQLNTLDTLKQGLDMKNEYIEIRNLFQCIKENSNSHEALEETDIKDIKKDVILFGDKIKKIKEALETEMMKLKVSEKLSREMLEETSVSVAKGNLKPKVKTYSDVVPSPVKAIIHSPLKCAETQDFHDFIATHGRYGRWVEYNHNIFVHVWQKYYRTYDEDFDFTESEYFETFVKEVMSKVMGVTKEEVLEHCDWYSKFLQLKFLQQEAIDRWKGNQLLMKVSRSQSAKDDDNRRKLEPPKRNKKLCQEENNERNSQTQSKGKDSKATEAELVERLSRPTGQWYNRVYGAFAISDTFGAVHDPNTIKRLRVPEWRSCLQEKQ